MSSFPAPSRSSDPSMVDPGTNKDNTEKRAPPPSLSSVNFSPDAELYDSLDDYFPTTTNTGELSLFDFLDSFSILPETLDKLNQRFKTQSKEFKEKLKTRIPPQYREGKLDIDLYKFRTTLNSTLTDLQVTWNDGKNVSTRDKIAFCSAVANIFITAFLLGIAPEKLPICYHRKGWHYFIADLCYWVNLMLVLFLWVFPFSSFLLIATYCLANGPVAWAIIAWRNSLVLHSFDKVVSLFIHIMPPLVLHTLRYLLPPDYSYERFPALHDTPSLSVWRGFWISTLVHTMWQGWYYFFIMVRRKEKIAAGRPTSFTWLRQSYAKTWIGKWVNSLPLALQPLSFMGIQYIYSLLTMIPSSLWYSSRLYSAIFLSLVFGWSVWNGATYYIDIFGKRFQKELEDLRAEVEKWQNSPLRSSDSGRTSGVNTPSRDIPKLDLEKSKGD